MGMQDRDWWREHYDKTQGRKAGRPDLEAFERSFEDQDQPSAPTSTLGMVAIWTAALVGLTALFKVFMDPEIGAWVLAHQRHFWGFYFFGGAAFWLWWLSRSEHSKHEEERHDPRYSPKQFRRWRSADRPRPSNKALAWRHLLWQVVGWALTVYFVGKWLVQYIKG